MTGIASHITWHITWHVSAEVITDYDYGSLEDIWEYGITSGGYVEEIADSGFASPLIRLSICMTDFALHYFKIWYCSPTRPPLCMTVIAACCSVEGILISDSGFTFQLGRHSVCGDDGMPWSLLYNLAKLWAVGGSGWQCNQTEDGSEDIHRINNHPGWSNGRKPSSLSWLTPARTWPLLTTNSVWNYQSASTFQRDNYPSSTVTIHI